MCYFLVWRTLYKLGVIAMFEERKHKWSWEVFVGCMFIGLGIGHIVGESGAGTLLGMGVGFILASFIRIERRVEIVVPKASVGVLSIIAGVFFIVLGLSMLGYISEEYLRMLGGIVFVIVGLALMVLGGRQITKTK